MSQIIRFCMLLMTTLNSAYNEKNMQRFCFIIGGFVKGSVIIGEWGIFGVETFLFSQFFIKGDFVIGGVVCTFLSAN